MQLGVMHLDPFLRHIPSEAIPTQTSRKAKIGLATMYGTPTDRKWGGGRMACAPAYRLRSIPTMNTCAHRTYKCGTILAIENVRTKKRTLCRVLDRGPYGALLADGTWVVKIKPTDPGVWRGIADLAPAVAAAIDHNGFERIRLWVVHVPARPIRVNRVGV